MGLKISCVDISVLYNSSVCAVALHLFCETHVTRVALRLFCETHVTDAVVVLSDTKSTLCDGSRG